MSLIERRVMQWTRVLGLVVSVAASLAVRASVKQEATRCIESPRGDTTRLRWWRYLLTNM